MDATPSGILDRLEWEYRESKHRPALAQQTLKSIQRIHPNLFKSQESLIVNMCGTIEALHPRIPVLRTTFALDAHSGTWIDTETGEQRTIWKAYRIEARYIYTEGEDRPKIEQLGPILVEPLGHVCNRDDRLVSWQDPICQVPLD